jgi:hypothetical protein
MHNYFKPWRRKAGVVTLVMALVLMGVWIRSMFYQDGLMIFGKRLTMIATAAGSLSWAVQEPDDGVQFSESWHWLSNPIKPDNDNDMHATEILGTPTYIHYSPIVISLTILAGFLLLWPVRRSKP